MGDKWAGKERHSPGGKGDSAQASTEYSNVRSSVWGCIAGYSKSVDEGDINLTNLTWLIAFVLHPKCVYIMCICNYIKNIFDMGQGLEELHLILKSIYDEYLFLKYKKQRPRLLCWSSNVPVSQSCMVDKWNYTFISVFWTHYRISWRNFGVKAQNANAEAPVCLGVYLLLFLFCQIQSCYIRYNFPDIQYMHFKFTEMHA